MFRGLKEVWGKLMARGYYQGEFRPKNPEKCINMRNGKKKAFARSSWETRMFTWCDLNDNVIEWGSEVLKVPYIFAVDQKLHNYIPDIWARIKGKDGFVRTYLLEIKPHKQTSMPKAPKNKTKKAVRNYNYAKIEYIKNKNKWEYARMFCEGKKWEFRILTENELF